MANPVADNSGKKVRVLIVEDHSVTARGLAQGLAESGGIEVVGIAGTAADALQLAEASQLDVILLDLHVPGGMGPVALVESLRKKSAAAIIVFTGDNRLALTQALLRSGVEAYLLKSETCARVVEVIDKVLLGHKPLLSRELVCTQVRLTPAEQELLTMLARGKKYSDMAHDRSSARATVRKQCETLMVKVEVKNREELIMWAVENGFGQVI